MGSSARSIGVLAAGVLLFAACAVVLERAHVPEPPPGVQVVERAHRLLSDAPAPPADDAAWEPATLPDRTAAAQRPASAWYRLDFTLQAHPDRLLAVYLRHPATNAAVFVNGALVGNAGLGRRPLPYYHADLRFVVSPELFRVGNNQIHILSIRERSQAFLGRVWIGDAAALATFKARTNVLARHAIRYLVVALLVFSTVYFALAWLRPQEPAYGWFAAALTMWAIHSIWPQFDKPLVDSAALWYPVRYIALGWFVLFAAVFVHRLTGRRRTVVERCLLGFGLLASAVLWVLAAWNDRWYAGFADYVWVPAILLTGLHIGRCLLHAQAEHRGAGTTLISVVAVCIIVVGFRDYAYDQGWLGPSVGRYLPYMAPVVLLAFGGMLLARVVHALNESEQLNRELESRVAQKSAELADNFQRLSQAQAAHARLDERQAIMRDMHDGIGAHLVQALAISERHDGHVQLHDILRNCLDELRLTIDTGSGGDEDLGMAMAGLRNRLQRRFKGTPPALEWPLDDVDRMPRWPPRRTLQFVRIVQEALTNVLKHAQASRVRVRCRVEAADGGECVALEVRDDGRGIAADGASGRGLSNMARRAADLGGTFALETGSSGTTVKVRVPIAAPDPP